MSLPTPYTVIWEPYEPAKDSHGDDVAAWGDPVDVAVHGWAPPGADKEPFEVGRRPVERDLEVYAPAGTSGAPMDRWTVAGTVYLQKGYPEDYSTGPWSVRFGVVINLERVEG